MSNDDETVERVAQAILSRITEIGSEVAGRPIQADEFDEMCASQYARAALSAMPQRELLREALSALTRLVAAVHRHEMANSHAVSHGDEMHHAEAAADKIRAALTQEKQT